MLIFNRKKAINNGQKANSPVLVLPWLINSNSFMQPPKYYLLFIVFVFMNCTPKTGQKILKNEKNNRPNSTLVLPEIREEQSELRPEITLSPKKQIIASLKTTPCYGKCPVYEIKFTRSQYVTWRGYANTARIGFYEARIEGKVLKEIEKKATMLRLFELDDIYPETGKFLEDYPAVVTHIYREGQEKRIVNIYDAPKALLDFENYLLEKTKGLEWSEIEEID